MKYNQNRKIKQITESVAVKYLWEVFLEGENPLLFIAIPIFRLHYTHTKT